MENQKPNVIPTQEQIDAANKANEAKIDEKPNNNISSKEMAAIKEMEEEALKQKNAVKNGETIVRPELADDDQRSIAIGKQQNTPEPPPVEKAKINPINKKNEENVIKDNENIPYDVIPLPSEGKIYPHKKTHIKVAYLNASDENILSSPNLLESGKFLSVLLNKKIIDEDINLNDLHVGDRNAIMIWLRATGYGEMYPIVVYDDNDRPFEVDVDLSTLKYKKLGAEPDENGLFEFVLPRTKKTVKFKMLSVGDIDKIEENAENELGYSNLVTDRLSYMIVEIDGVTDKNNIKDFINIMPIADSRALRNYYDEIESNVDLNIQVETPKIKDDETGEVRGGDLINTFLPININFFWPDLGV